jgi:branched-chain amino acid transport system ATP-binding protein
MDARKTGPTSSVTGRATFDIMRAVSELSERGLTVLLVEQNARAALRISTYGYVLEMGRFVAKGDAQQLMNDERLIESYLGSSSSQMVVH